MKGKFLSKEIDLIVELREEGLVGQRLYDKFSQQYPGRSWQSIRGKIERLRETKVIKR